MRCADSLLRHLKRYRNAAYLHRWRFGLSDGQYEYAAVAAACAANVSRVAPRSLHKHAQLSRSRDQTGRNWDLQLLTADKCSTQGLPVDDNNRRRDKLAAHYAEHSTRLHLSKI